ncbi:MAG: GrpB family protein [Pirellulaceae bacterium]
MDFIDPCSLLIPIIIFELIGYAILWPVLKKGTRLSIPRQFSVADFAVLLGYAQVVMTVVFHYRPRFEVSNGLVLLIFILGIAIVVLWGAAVSTLNQLKIQSLVRRSTFLLVLLPGVICLQVGVPIVLISAANNTKPEDLYLALFTFFGGLGIVVSLAIGLRFLGGWLVKDAKEVLPPSPEPIVGGYYLPADLNLRPIIIVDDYDPSWPQIFESLRSRVSEVVGDIAISIEHVGSTAVPGLAAKPIIDMGIVVPSQIEVAMAINRLAPLGYVHRGDLGIAGREAFRSPNDLPPHHLYLYIRGNPALANHLAVRDFLRRDPAAASAYGKLKKDLAKTFPGDIDSYIDGKTDFLLAILRQAGLPAEQLDAIEAANRKS